MSPTGRPTSPLAQAELTLTVIRHPPFGDVVFDDGSAALRDFKSYYPELVERFGESTILAATARAHGRFGADACYFCYAAALARFRSQGGPLVTKATKLLLGEPCSRHTTEPTEFRASAAASASGPRGPAAPARTHLVLPPRSSRERLASWIRLQCANDPLLSRAVKKLLG